MSLPLYDLKFRSFVLYIYKMLPLSGFISAACPNFLLVVYATDMKEANLSQFVSFCRAAFTIFLNHPVFLALVFPQISSARCNWPSSHTREAFPPSSFSAFVSFSATRMHLCVCALTRLHLFCIRVCVCPAVPQQVFQHTCPQQHETNDINTFVSLISSCSCSDTVKNVSFVLAVGCWFQREQSKGKSHLLQKAR